MLTFVNTMGPTISVFDAGGQEISRTPSSGYLLETKRETHSAGTLQDGQVSIPLVRVRYSEVRVTHMGQPATLPEPQPGVYYLVRSSVLEAWPREDFLAPGEAVKDRPNGQIIGCLSFKQPII